MMRKVIMNSEREARAMTKLNADGFHFHKFTASSKKIGMLSAFITTLTLMVSIFALSSGSVSAQSIRVEPLKYDEQLELGQEKTGYVDVSNPGDFDITISTEVEAFRQINTDGDLEFYEDEQISQGINIDVDEFDLGPREAARIFFEIDSNQLPEGGVYAALLFAVESGEGDGFEASGFGTTTRVGTLLLLENGDEVERDGSFIFLDMSFLQFGSAISGVTEFAASDGERYVAFTPELSVSMPIAGQESLESGLVFAGNSRVFDIEREGNYLGLFPVTVSDEVTGEEISRWIFAVTGVWQIIVPLFILAILLSLVLQYHFSRK